MYNFIVVNSCKKDFKKLSRDAQKFIRHSCFPIILKNPFAGEKLKGRESQGILKFSVRFKSVDYRVVYQIKTCPCESRDEKLIIIFVMIASRENFYKKLKNRI